MLRRSVIALFVVGVLASIASVPQSVPQEEYTELMSIGANPVVFPVALTRAQRRVRLRVTLEPGEVANPTAPHLGLNVTARFDDEARAVPARVRAGLLAPDDVDTTELGLLTFVLPDETHQLELSGQFIAEVLLVREDDGEGIVSLALTVVGDLLVEDEPSVDETIVLRVEQLADDST